MANEKRVKEKIVYEPVARLPAELLGLLRLLDELTEGFHSPHNESELPIIA
jgi:hypothetical protein